MAKILFMDLEMLCWPNHVVPIGQTEHIIQLGICEVDANTLTIEKELDIYVKPNFKFEVSEYCTNLTGITHDVVKSGRGYSESLSRVVNEFAPNSKVTYAWGSDNDAIVEHCKRHKCKNPWEKTSIWDLGTFFRSSFNINHKMSLSKALNHLNLEFEGIPHSAITDARNLAYLYIEMMKRLRK